MLAIHIPFRASSPRRTALIAAAVAALAAGAALLEPPERAPWAASAGPQGAMAATVPVGIVGESAVARDPSVPSAASVFERSKAQVEEPPVTF